MNLCLLYHYLNFCFILKLCNSCKKTGGGSKESKKKKSSVNFLLIVVKTLVVVEKFNDYLQVKLQPTCMVLCCYSNYGWIGIS